MKMDIFKPIRLRRIDKAREKEARRIEKEQKKIAEEEKEKEFQQFLEIAKKGEFLLNCCSNIYVNKIGKNLDDYDFKNVEVIDGGYKEMNEVVLDTKALLIEKAKKLGAEVVVDVKPSIAYYDRPRPDSSRVVYITGTALIPKKK